MQLKTALFDSTEFELTVILRCHAPVKLSLIKGHQPPVLKDTGEAPGTVLLRVIERPKMFTRPLSLIDLVL
jgi:hypothetical protein